MELKRKVKEREYYFFSIGERRIL